MDRIMHVSVTFHEERLDFEIPDDRVVSAWSAPAGMDSSQTRAAVRDALEMPWEFPPLRQMIVPGDRVVIALDSSIAGPRPILEVLGQTLRAAGVETGGITVLMPAAGTGDPMIATGIGDLFTVHDSRDRAQLAYLAATKEGRRVYLNRLLTDADVVIPVGRLGYDPHMGHRGPWSVVFPDLSERETIEAYRSRPPREPERLGALPHAPTSTSRSR